MALKTSKRQHCLISLTLASILATTTISAGPIEDNLASLRQHRYSATPIQIPVAGLSFSRDTATWTLEAGTIRLQEPIDGVVTGLVFEGRGHFRMTVPDRFELRQLRRLAKEPALDAVDTSFSTLILRTSEPFGFEWLGELKEQAASTYTAHELVAERHEHWLIKRFQDIDSRVLLGLHVGADAYLRAGMKTEAYDWLTWQNDDLELEEISLAKFQDMNDFTETWLSLDRPEDRTADGLPNGLPRRQLDLEHVSISVDVTDRSTRGSVGRSRTSLSIGHFIATLSLTPTRDGIGAVLLSLGPGSRVESVADGEGRELSFVRAHIGELTGSLDDRWNDNSLSVFLPEKIGPGTSFTLRIAYQRELLNYVSGRGWYPTPPSSIDDLHTAHLRITARKRSEVRAIGSFKEKIAGDEESVTWVYEMAEPTKMHGFSFADRFVEEEIELEGIPKVISFSPPVSSRSKTMARNVGTDIANSLRFFQWLFDSELQVDQMYATGIAAGHGQAFEGFLHLSEITYAQESINTSELFRSHEVAHQWWGHLVGWKTYRDQWLSEAFAEYSSMMFVESTTKKGSETFEDILNAYTELLLGKRIANINRFVRPWMAGVDSQQRQRLGPIGHGYRASNCEMPQGYTLQNYYKGPMVLHMLRHLLQRPGDGDALFIQVLRDFVAENRGQSASTADFRRAIEKRAGGDWGWFFDQWIYGTAIPSYTWSYEVSQEGGQSILELTVRQEDVPEGFIMSVPVRLELAGGKSGTVRVTVQKPEETFRLPVPSAPKKVEFNPDFAVLARVSKG